MKRFSIQVKDYLIILQKIGCILFEKLEIRFEIQLGTNKNEKPLKFIQFLCLDLESVV